MGVLRTILAMLVVCSHLRAFGGVFAVKSFFIISGFYMALIIHTHYHASARSMAQSERKCDHERRSYRTMTWLLHAYANACEADGPPRYDQRAFQFRAIGRDA